MKPLILYKTRTGNTSIIAEAISSVLDADILTVGDAVPDDLKNRTLVGFGSGIYWARIDRKIYETASYLPKNCKVFMFITSGMGYSLMLELYWFYIKSNFKRLSLKLIGKWDCRGHDQHPLFKWMGISKGRPNKNDIESAKIFALELKQELLSK